MTEKLEIVKCSNGVGEWEIYPTGETFDTRREAEERLREMLGAKPVYIHDFDFVFTVPSFQSDPDKVTPDEIVEQFKRTLANMEDWEIFERSGHVQTIDPDIHMTTAADCGLQE